MNINCICSNIVIGSNAHHFSVWRRLCQPATCAMSSADASAMEFIVHGVRVKEFTGTKAAREYVQQHVTNDMILGTFANIRDRSPDIKTAAMLIDVSEVPRTCHAA